MDPLVEVALISSVPPTLAALVAVWLGIQSNHSQKTAKIKLNEVSIQLDGRLTELLELTRKASHAEGVKAQKKKEERTQD